MTARFSVRTTPRYESLARKLVRRHREFRSIQEEAIAILERDPTTRNRQQKIKKLEAVDQGDGQMRLALRRFRFRYDIYGREVVLHFCGLRREDTYRRR